MRAFLSSPRPAFASSRPCFYPVKAPIRPAPGRVVRMSAAGSATSPAAPPRQVMRNQQRPDPRSVRYWTAKDMPPLDGKTYVVTGASSGMGYSTAESIAQKGGNVILAGRSLERCRKAADMIKNTGARGKVEAMHLDLTSFQSIVDFANAFKKKNIPLHVLVENAGVFLVPFDRTQEGFETTVGTNYFGHFLLSHLLLDNLKQTAKDTGEARIVAMASLFEQLGKVRWDDLEGYKAIDSSLFEYSNSKLMVIMAGRELNKRLKGTDVELFLSQPGLVQTELNGRKLDHRKVVAIGVDIATKIYGQNAERASNCLKRPATDPNVKGWGGSYFSPPWIGLLALQTDNGGMQEPSNKLARDEAAWSNLYCRTLDIVNQKLVEKGLDKIQAA